MGIMELLTSFFTDVLRLAPAEVEVAEEIEDEQQDAKAGAFAESFRDAHRYHERANDIKDWHKQNDECPDRLTADLTEDVDVINRNQ